MIAAAVLASISLAYFAIVLEIALNESRYYTARHARTRAYRPRHAAGRRVRLTWRTGQHAVAVTA